MSDPLALLGDLMVRSTLLILLASAATALLRKAGASAAMRHQIWLWTVAGLFLLPVLAITMPALPIMVLPETASTPSSAPIPSTAAVLAVPASTEAASLLPDLLLSAYLAIAGAMMAWLLAGQRELGRLWRSAVPANAEWTSLLAEAAADLRLSGQVELRLAPHSLMPMTWGTFVPKIILPAEARDWAPARRRFVLLHELGHIRRRDSLTQTAAAVLRVLYWFHPGAWLVAMQLRLEQELAADDLALGAGVPPRGYARNLLELACAFCLPAPAMARRSQLEQRLVAIIQAGSRRAPGPGLGAVVASLALAATWVIATAIPVERAAATPLAEAAVDRQAQAALPIRSGPSAPAAAFHSDKPKAAPHSVRAAPPAERPPSDPYDDALSRYHRDMAAYDNSLESYGGELAAYERRLNVYERALADYRLRLATYRAASPGQMTPPVAPIAPMPPIPPTAPVPPIPPAA